MQINTTWHDHFVKVNESVKNSDVYKSIVINNRIHAKNRTNFIKIIKYLLEEGLLFVFIEFLIYPFKSPSSGPHPAVHFL